MEIAILIVVALILFIILRNFPKTRDNIVASERKNNIFVSLYSKLFSRVNKKNEEEIKRAINQGQEKIVSPKEISDAKEKYWTDDPDIAKILYEANKALLDHEYAKAEKKALEALAKDTRCDQAYVFVSEVAMHRKNYDDAREAARAALKCNKDNAHAFAILGEASLFGEKYSDSINNYQKAVNLDRNQAAWQAGLGKAYLEVRQFAKAAKALKRASSLDIDNKDYKRLASLAEDKQKMHTSVYKK